MTSNEQPDEEVRTAEQQGAGDEPAAGAQSQSESAPEGAVAADGQAQPAPAEEPADPLEGKTDEEVRALAAEGAGYLALAQRTRADFDNYRKRTQRDLAAAKVRGGVELARELVGALDNIERALEHEAQAASEHEAAERLLQALRTAQADVIAALNRNGITPIAAEGEVFDPTLHEAIARRPVEAGETSGTCVVVFQTGYAAGDEIVRPARVVVAD